VQMIRMEKNAGEVDDFLKFWTAVEGVDQVRIKEDETNMMRPDAGHEGSAWKHPCHYLWRGPMYVKQDGNVWACCQSYIMGGGPVGSLETTSLEDVWNSAEMVRMRRLHVSGRAGEIDVCAKCCTTIPHPVLVLGSLVLHGKTVRRLLPVVERLTYLSKLPKSLLSPPKGGVQTVISGTYNGATISGDISETPNVMLSNQTVWSLYESLLAPTTRSEYNVLGGPFIKGDTDLGQNVDPAKGLTQAAGATSLRYRGMAYVRDQKSPSGKLWMMNENWFDFRSLPLKDHDLSSSA